MLTWISWRLAMLTQEVQGFDNDSIWLFDADSGMLLNVRFTFLPNHQVGRWVVSMFTDVI